MTTSNEHNNAPAVPTKYEALEVAIWRLEDMLKADDGQAWKEAEKALPRLREALLFQSQEPAVPQGWGDGVRVFSPGPMTHEKAAYFMRRFKSEEKLLGPNEQAAIDFVLSMLSAPALAVPSVQQGWVEQMLTDARHVFDARGPETPQETRDVIEYVASWIAAYRDNLAATPAPAPAQEPTKETFQSRYEREFMERMAENHSKLTEFCAALESFTHDYQRLYSTYKSYRDMISDLIKERDSLREQVAKPAQEGGAA